MPTATLRRPGIAFETRTPAIGDALPRLDVAAFVGFAISGPIGTPVPVEDLARFHEIFGTDVRLAWDDVRGDWQYGELAPAVRSFFRNGGQRCWVVRVARSEQASTNCFPIPGVLATEPNGITGAAAASARSPGSWSDELLVNATVSLRPLARPRVSDESPASLVSGARAGDLVRLHYDTAGITAFLAVIEPPRPAAKSDTPRVADSGSWFERVTRLKLAPDVAAPDDAISWLESPVTVRQLAGAAASDAPVDLLIGVDGWGWRGERELVVQLDSSAASNIRPGAWLRMTMAAPAGPRSDEIYILIEQVEHAETHSPPDGAVTRLVSGSAWWLLDPADAALTVAEAVPQRTTVELELWVRSAGSTVTRLAALGCASGHARFWGDAPDDDRLFALDDSGRPVNAGRSVDELGMHSVVDRPRFPLAALPAAAAPVRLLPLASLAFPREEMYQPAIALSEPATFRDGLATLDETLFLDRGLAETRAAALLSEATQIQYVLPRDDGSGRAGRRLTGMHALVPIEEIAMIAVPDAVLRGWRGRPHDPSALGAPLLSEAKAAPDDAGIRVRWTVVPDAAAYDVQASTDPRFATRGALWLLEGSPAADASETMSLLDATAAIVERLPVSPGIACPPAPCEDTGYYYRVRARDARGIPGPWSNTRHASRTEQAFTPARQPTLGAPAMLTIVEERGRLVLDWSSPDGATAGAAVSFTVERARDAAFDSATVVYRGSAPHFEVWRVTDEVSYFRVTADVDGRATAWSATVAAGDAHSDTVLVESEAEFVASMIERVHVALLRLCAARGDCHAILGLPLHFRDEAATAHARRLAERIQTEDGDPRPLSFGALFHPWPVVRETTDVARVSTWAVVPDGSMCGVLAARTLRSAAWYSAANQPLAGAVSLEPPLDDKAADALLAARVNALTQQPRGFVAIDELTLSPDPELSALHVRRLMILLRRLALREGTELVFMPYDDALRRQAERLFDRLLGDMYARGAFAGGTAEESYRVVADARLNSPQSMEQGRLIVELRVAPSSPLNFLTVRLVQQGGELLSAQESS